MKKVDAEIKIANGVSDQVAYGVVTLAEDGPRLHCRVPDAVVAEGESRGEFARPMMLITSLTGADRQRFQPGRIVV
jgi:hypothetical protein